jgi:hypothetical protein
MTAVAEPRRWPLVRSLALEAIPGAPAAETAPAVVLRTLAGPSAGEGDDG